jgi:hypothetical protein
MLICAAGITRRLLAPVVRDPLTVAVAGAGFGLGLVTLVILWGLILTPGGPVFAIALAATLLLAMAGVASPAAAPATSPRPGILPAGLRLLRAVLLAGIALCCTAILTNAVLWPFEVGDALALYGPFGRHIYETATLPLGDRLHEAYPMLVPIAFAFTHWAGGEANEYVARLVTAAMAVAVVGTGGILAREMGGRVSGWAAAALIAFTPVFGRWASSGYTDVPSALYVGLAAIFVWRWWVSGDVRPLLVAGMSAGLAMWTKNSTLALLPSLVLLVLTRPFFDSPPARPRPLRDLAVVLGSAAAVAGPWYLRNVVVFGFAVPPTIFVDKARHTPAAFATLLQPDHHFGLSGWIVTAAVIHTVACVLGRRRGAPACYVLLVLLGPFVAAWWWLASYEARFLLAVFPVLAAMGGLMIADLIRSLRLAPSARAWRPAIALALLVVAGAAATALRKTIEHKAVLVRTPWLDDAARHRVRVGGLYDLAIALNALPDGSRVAGVPSIIRYYLDTERLATIDVASRRELPRALARDYEFVVYRTPDGAGPAAGAGQPLFRTGDGYVLYSTAGAGVGTDGARVEE